MTDEIPDVLRTPTYYGATALLSLDFVAEELQRTRHPLRSLAMWPEVYAGDRGAGDFDRVAHGIRETRQRLDELEVHVESLRASLADDAAPEVTP